MRQCSPAAKPLGPPQITHQLDRACETFSFGSGGESGAGRSRLLLMLRVLLLRMPLPPLA